MKAIVMPELDCPFESVVNENADEVQEETFCWALGFGLLPDERSRFIFRATRIARLAARFHPSAARDELRLISDFYAWMFLRDDHYDESEAGESPGRMMPEDARFLEILEGREPDGEDGPLACAMRDIGERIREKAPSAGWTRRLLRSVEQHFASSLWEAQNRARGVVPEPETYVRMRRITGGILVDLDLVEIADAVRVPPEVLDHPVVRAMAEASNNVACWENDLFSLKKELEHGDVHNLVIVLSHADGISLECAVERAVRMHDDEIRRFVDLEESLPEFGPGLDEGLARYVTVLRARMRGHLDWARESGRYRHQKVA